MTGRLAPYGKRLTPGSAGSIAVLTGARAWERAVSETWFPGHKLVLPTHEDPGIYLWPVEDRDCLIFSFGKPEPPGLLQALSVELVQAGALFVVWCLTGDTPATLYRPAGGGL